MSAQDHEHRRRLESMRAHPSNHVRRTSTIELTECPKCAQPAQILHRFAISSADAHEHVRVRCLSGHLYLVPAGSADPPSRS